MYILLPFSHKSFRGVGYQEPCAIVLTKPSHQWSIGLGCQLIVSFYSHPLLVALSSTSPNILCILLFFLFHPIVHQYSSSIACLCLTPTSPIFNFHFPFNRLRASLFFFILCCHLFLFIVLWLAVGNLNFCFFFFLTFPSFLPQLSGPCMHVSTLSVPQYTILIVSVHFIPPLIHHSYTQTNSNIIHITSVGASH